MLEIAEEIGIPLKEVACALDAVSEPVSFFEPAYNDGEDGMEIIDQLADKKENSENWTEKSLCTRHSNSCPRGNCK